MASSTGTSGASGSSQTGSTNLSGSYFSDPEWYKENMAPDIADQSAKALGMTTDQYFQFLAENTNTGDRNESQRILTTMNKYGNGSGGQQVAAAPTNPMLDPSSATNPVNAASALGAAALNMPMVVNPIPGQGTMSKGGVNPVQAASVGTSVPAVPEQYLSQPGVFAKAPSLTPTQGGTYGGAVTPATPPTAAPYSAAPKPFAVAPPAPGATMQQPTVQPVQSAQTPTPFLAAHTSALANAGQALYSHFGGDPNTASPNDISNFHNQVMNAVSSGAQMAAPATGAVAPIKMARGGFVPGDGDEDSVLAALTPGEYVIPKAQIKKAIDNPPPEVRSPKAQPSAEVQSMPNSAPAATTVDAAGQVQPASSSSSSSPSLGSSDFSKTLAQAAQNQQANRDFAAMGTGGYSAPAGSSATTVGDVAGGAAIPNAGQTQSLGKVGPSAASGASSAIGGLASGLASAAKAYADSIKPWQVQASAIPNPDDFKKQPTYTFQPVGT